MCNRKNQPNSGGRHRMHQQQKAQHFSGSMQQNHLSSSCFASKCLSCTTNQHCPSDHPSIYPPICMHACNKQIIHSLLQWTERPTWDSISMFQRKLLSRCSSVAISGSVDTVGANLKGMKPLKLSHQQRTENTMPLFKTKQNHQFCLQAFSSSAPKLWNALPINQGSRFLGGIPRMSENLHAVWMTLHHVSLSF